MGIELGIGVGHINWEIKHIAPLELLNTGLESAIDIAPRWGYIYLKKQSFAKPAITLTG
jgi:hypothetical protein